jgi:hypothetical protein
MYRSGCTLRPEGVRRAMSTSARSVSSDTA